MPHFLRFLTGLLLVIGIHASKAQATDVTDPLVGTFAVSIDGKDVPLIRVSRDGWKFTTFFHGMPDEPKKGWEKSSDLAMPFRSEELRMGGDLVRNIPFPDSIKDLPEGALCLWVDRNERLDGGAGGYALFYIPKDFEYGNFGKSEMLPSGYYLTADTGAIERLKKVQ
jgi:hypothetical protein